MWLCAEISVISHYLLADNIAIMIIYSRVHNAKARATKFVILVIKVILIARDQRD